MSEEEKIVYLKDRLKHNIEKINEKLALANDVYSGEKLNDYQIVRLKAIRMKCKEILRWLYK